jgi:MFS family permease
MALLPQEHVLRHSSYRNYLFGNTLFIIGMQMQGLIVGWHLYELTGDPFALGLSGLAEAIPYMICALVGGHLADNLNRKSLILLSVGGYVLCAVAFYCISHPRTPLSSSQKVLTIYSVIVATGICRGFLSPSKSAVLAQIIPKDRYLEGSTWYSILWQIAAVSGPAAGGLILANTGVANTYGVVALFALAGLVFFSRIKVHKLNAIKKEAFFPGLKAGFSFVWKHPLLLPAFGLDMIAVLFGGAVALLPVFNDQILLSGAEGLGLLRMAPAAGAVMMGLVLTRISIRSATGIIFLGAVAAFGVCILVFAFSKIFWLSWVALFCSGAMDNISVVVRTTIMQTFTPEDLRGRVSSINSLFISTSNEIGAFESGLAAKLLGLVPSVVFGGTITLGVTIWVGLASKALRQLSFDTPKIKP